MTPGDKVEEDFSSTKNIDGEMLFPKAFGSCKLHLKDKGNAVDFFGNKSQEKKQINKVFLSLYTLQHPNPACGTQHNMSNDKNLEK